jgi:hypothetical protein
MLKSILDFAPMNLSQHLALAAMRGKKLFWLTLFLIGSAAQSLAQSIPNAHPSSETPALLAKRPIGGRLFCPGIGGVQPDPQDRQTITLS